MKISSGVGVRVHKEDNSEDEYDHSAVYACPKITKGH